MIYDSHGTPLRRKLGFLRGYTAIRVERVTDLIATSRISCEENTLDDTPELCESGDLAEQKEVG